MKFQIGNWKLEIGRARASNVSMPPTSVQIYYGKLFSEILLRKLRPKGSLAAVIDPIIETEVGNAAMECAQIVNSRMLVERLG